MDSKGLSGGPSVSLPSFLSRDSMSYDSLSQIPSLFRWSPFLLLAVESCFSHPIIGCPFACLPFLYATSWVGLCLTHHMHSAQCSGGVCTNFAVHDGFLPVCSFLHWCEISWKFLSGIWWTFSFQCYLQDLNVFFAVLYILLEIWKRVFKHCYHEQHFSSFIFFFS